MKERELDITSLTRSEFDLSPFDDIANGPGLSVEVGSGQAQIFPAARVVRAELAGVRARISALTQVAVENETIVANAQTDSFVTTLRLGAQNLDLSVSKMERPALTLVPAVAEQEVFESKKDISGEPEAGNTPVEASEQERITLTGRIGYKPRFRETAGGTLVGQFALGVHDRPGETTWHSIVAFGPRAEKLRESGLARGDEVSVIGYPHERQRTNPKTREARTVVEVYAAVVKRPKEKDDAQTPSPRQIPT